MYFFPLRRDRETCLGAALASKRGFPKLRYLKVRNLRSDVVVSSGGAGGGGDWQPPGDMWPPRVSNPAAGFQNTGWGSSKTGTLLSFCLDVRTLTFCQLMGFPFNH